MIYLFYWIGFSLLIGILSLFRKKLWYKWIYESVSYPLTKCKVRNDLKYMLDSQKIKYYTDLAISEKWFKDYWFYRRLERYILLEHISKIVE